ncbi:MAG TPA: IPT/TIG domain-containing protein, partial [Acidobacteriaceae bacterium]|nr:IPT/TIG domain-containing protein [Acidobacteriaceae bacterium]
APTVSSVSPSNGPVAGGTAVTITGTNFAAGAKVTFGSTAATSVVVVSSTTITATTPAGSAGAVTVTVTNVGSQSGSLANAFAYTVAATISFSQVASATPQSATATVSVSYPGEQTQGDMNVVVVGWNDTTSTVQSVKDSAGNTYSLAIGPTSGTALRQSIYYAPVSVTGGNTVTVTFSQAAAYPDVRILEYTGVTTLDVTAGASGNSTSANSGAATTTGANELIFGADMVATTTAAAGSGFTPRIITSQDGDIAEDKVVTSAGSNSATATLSSTGPWVMQMVTFAAVSGPAPTVSSVSPNSGSTSGGTAVTITGTNFAAGATVTFGSTAATSVVVVNSTTITATTPAGSAGAVLVTVTSSGQSSGLANGFTYIAAPTVSSVSPSNGPVAGGTAVTITGTNFAAGAKVTFGSTAATSVAVVNSTTITATTPAGSAGAATVTVTANGQSGSLASAFTYIAQPTVSSVSPNNGSTSGGTAVTITGTNFAAGATVTFGSTAATNVVVVNSTTITATTPAGSTGAVTVTVTNVGSQSGSLTNGFTYVVKPTISNVSPNNGPVAGGTAVTITGTNFATGATVTFGSTAATSVAVVNSTTITATTPAGSAGAVTVTVTANGQSGSLASAFTYITQPTVSSVSPSSGSTSGGTAVTITGTNFAAGATVTFGSTAATSVVVVSSTTITATTPAGSAGAVTVTVANVGSQSGSLANAFTYTVAATISFSQVASATPQSPTATVSVSYPAAQTPGDMNVVVVGWNDTTSTVQSVKDSAENTYSLAIGPTSGTALRQSIYYASKIAGGSNTVTVTFSQAATYPDVRVLEYKGVTTLDVVAGASGNSTAANSGAVMTTSANELIFGADTVATTTTKVGTGFTSRVITTPDGDIAEDKIVTTAGSNSATATLTSGPWVMQVVAFK